MSQIWVQGSHFSEVNGYCWFWWCFNRKVWLIDHVIIVMLIIVSAMGGLQKCPKFDLCNFCILCTCPKSCFGGLNEQSGYLVSHLFIDAGLEERSKGSVHQHRIIQLSRSAGKTLSGYLFTKFYDNLILLVIDKEKSLHELRGERRNQPCNVNGFHLFKAAKRMALAHLNQVFN